MEVFYIRDDGVRVRSFAILSRRTIPSQWLVGDNKLSDLKQISYREWLLGRDGPDWEASAEAMIR